MSRDEINRLLAEKVMGWHIVNVSTKSYAPAYTPTYDAWVDENNITCVSPAFVWNPYGDIAQAMMVADKVIAMGYHFELKYNNYDGKFAWSAAFDESDTWGFQQINSTSACEAICLAALKVVEND